MRVRESGRVEAEVVVNRDRDNATGAEAQDPRSAVVRVVGLLGDEDRERLCARKPVIPGIGAAAIGARRQRRQVASRPTRGEQALDVRTEAQRRAQPLQQPLLHGVGDGAHLVLGGAVVEHGRDELCQDGGADRRGDLVPHVARVVEVVRVGKDRRQQLRERHARAPVVRRSPALEGDAGRRVGEDRNGAAAGFGEVVGELVDDGVARRAKSFRIVRINHGISLFDPGSVRRNSRS